ncbi:MAG: heavy metal translocating P-type ATPase, partial [Candidatus Lokiarchaeota archaeon]|nr:heavy metal translocating P-type ATPase [Candidatus Lokiarchaeota archaeon]MBD3200785.1 heavy metal translocating P-type ATPase [Candidatus Lokiarchaeota archaeon]
MDNQQNQDKESSKEKQRRKMMEDFKKRFYASLILTVPILLFSPTIQSLFGISIFFPGISIVSLILSTIIFFYGGFPFL